MTAYEYKVVPAPAKGKKAKGVKTPEARFALSLEQLLNTYGAQGWDYQRTDTLPSTERSGLTGSQNIWRHVLVFRRPISGTAQDAPPPLRTEEPLRIAHHEDVVETAADDDETPLATAPPQEPERAAKDAAPIRGKTLKSPFDSDV